MKKEWLIFYLLLLFLNFNGVAQNFDTVIIIPKTLIPLKEFKNDRMAFMDRNFGYGNRLYENKTISFFLNEMAKEHPFYFVVDEVNPDYHLLARVIVFFYSKQELKKMLEEGKEVWGVYAWFNENVEPPSPLYEEFKQIGIGKIIKWNGKKYNVIFSKVTYESTYTADFTRKLKKIFENE